MRSGREFLWLVMMGRKKKKTNPKVDLDVSLWEDELCKNIRIASADRGVAVTFEWLREEEENKKIEQSVFFVRLLHDLPQLMTEILERSNG